MKRRFPFAAVCGLAGTLLLSRGAWAQEQDTVVPRITAIGPTGITVHGHAELKFAPDIATLTVGVMTQAGKQADAARDNAQKTTAVLNALKAAGLPAADIQTGSYNAAPQYDYKNGRNILTGFQVTNTLQVTVRDLTKIGGAIDAATNAGATSVDGPLLDLADRSKAEGDALEAAIKNARAKAERMASAAGVTLGPLVSLSEGSAPPIQPVMFRAMKADAAEAPTPIVPGQITINADVTEVFAIR